MKTIGGMLKFGYKLLSYSMFNFSYSMFIYISQNVSVLNSVVKYLWIVWNVILYSDSFVSTVWLSYLQNEIHEFNWNWIGTRFLNKAYLATNVT